MGSQHGTGRGQQTAQFIHARVEFGRKLLRQSGEKSGKRVVYTFMMLNELQITALSDTTD